ncbi:MAG: alpha/beta hydrolase [Pyrinomonadaceae bacterium]
MTSTILRDQVANVDLATPPEYQVHGSGEPLVYVCGIEGTGLNFFKQLPDLINDHQIITYPLRPTGKYGLEQLVADLAWILRDAGIERATLIGESFGGLVVQAMALAHPQAVNQIILVNTFATFLNPLKVKVGLALYSWLPLWLVTKYRSSRSGAELFSDDIEEPDRARFLRNTSTVGLEGYLSRLRIIRDTNLLPRLHQIEVPALVVTSTADRMLDAMTSGRAMAEQLPRARVRVLEGTGHCALLSNRVRVRDWLKELANV